MPVIIAVVLIGILLFNAAFALVVLIKAAQAVKETIEREENSNDL